MSFSEKVIAYLTVSIWVMIAILAVYNIGLQVNHTGSGHRDNNMKKLGFFRSPEGEGNGATAPEETTAVDTAQETTQTEEAPEGDEQTEESGEE